MPPSRVGGAGWAGGRLPQPGSCWERGLGTRPGSMPRRPGGARAGRGARCGRRDQRGVSRVACAGDRRDLAPRAAESRVETDEACQGKEPVMSQDPGFVCVN